MERDSEAPYATTATNNNNTDVAWVHGTEFCTLGGRDAKAVRFRIQHNIWYEVGGRAR